MRFSSLAESSKSVEQRVGLPQPESPRDWLLWDSSALTRLRTPQKCEAAPSPADINAPTRTVPPAPGRTVTPLQLRTFQHRPALRFCRCPPTLLPQPAPATLLAISVLCVDSPFPPVVRLRFRLFHHGLRRRPLPVRVPGNARTPFPHASPLHSALQYHPAADVLFRSRPTCNRARPCKPCRTGSSASRERTRRSQIGSRYDDNRCPNREGRKLRHL
jgi:hypothetical protein